MRGRRTDIIELEDPNGFPENVGAVVHLKDAATKVGPRTYRKRILRYGAWNHKAAPGGVLTVDKSYGEKLVANFSAKVFDAVGVVKGHPKDDADAINNAAGAVLALDDAGGPDGPGVYATVMVPEDVATAIDAGDTSVVGCSAGIIPNYVDHERGGKGAVGPVLEHLALTPTPYIKGLGGFTAVHLADNHPVVLLSASDDTNHPEDVMDRNELIAKAKELGVDIEALEADAAKVPGLTSELADTKDKLEKAPPAKTADEIAAETAAIKETAVGEVVAALSEGMVKEGLITLSDSGKAPTLGELVGGIAKAIAEPKAALRLSEAEADVDAAIKAGRALPAARDSLLKVRLSEGGDELLKGILPEKPLVDLSEIGTTGADDPGTVTLSDGTKADDEITRLVALAEEIDA